MQTSFTSDRGPSGVEEEAVASVATRKSVRITGISVGIMEPDKRAVLVNLKLDGTQFSKLSPIDPKAISKQHQWPFSLNLQEGSELTVELKRKRLFSFFEKVIVQVTVSFDKIRSFLDSPAQDQSTKYRIHTAPEITLSLDSGTVTPQACMATAMHKSEEISSILGQLGEWQLPLATLLETSTAISEVHPVAEAVLGTFNVVYCKLLEQDACTEQIRDLATNMTNICRFICDVDQFARMTQLKAAMEEAQRLMEKIENLVTSWAAKQTADFFLNDSTKQELDQLTTDYNVFQQQFDRGIAIDSASNIDLLLKLQQEEKDDKLLKQLQPKGIKGMQPASECLSETVTEEFILLNVDHHLDEFDGPQTRNILWIYGPAGTGKSALASTIAFRLHARRRLGSYFVFERAKTDITTTSALWRHVGHDLAEKYPSARRSTIQQLEAKQVRLDTPNSEDLFERLVEQALKDPTDIPPGRMPVIVIDALDECGGLEGHRSAGRRELLKALKRWPRLSTKIKLIVTSRPEKDIARALSTISIPFDLYAVQCMLCATPSHDLSLVGQYT